MSNFTKDDYEKMARRRKVALKAIAEALGKEHPLTKMMGPMAWGRNDAEQGADHSLRTAIREMSFLDGACDILKRWASENDAKARDVILSIYPCRWESKGDSCPHCDDFLSGPVGTTKDCENCGTKVTRTESKWIHGGDDDGT